jgi:transcriptional regulator with XRE-family HTH domain
MILGARIRMIREASGLTQADVAFEIGVSASAYSQMERKAGNCSYYTLCKIAQSLKVSVPFLLDIDNPEIMIPKK